MAVTKEKIYEEVYKEFYDLIKAINGFSLIVYPAFSENVKDAKADYPQVVINSPDIDWKQFTQSKNITDGTIDIEIYTTTAKDTDVKASAVNNKIEISKTTLASAGLQKVFLESSTSDNVFHGKIKVFIKTLAFTYKFTSAKTRAF